VILDPVLLAGHPHPQTQYVGTVSRYLGEHRFVAFAAGFLVEITMYAGDLKAGELSS
jgi:hypothetical protein